MSERRVDPMLALLGRERLRQLFGPSALDTIDRPDPWAPRPGASIRADLEAARQRIRENSVGYRDGDDLQREADAYREWSQASQ